MALKGDLLEPSESHNETHVLRCDTMRSWSPHIENEMLVPDGVALPSLRFIATSFVGRRAVATLLWLQPSRKLDGSSNFSQRHFKPACQLLRLSR